MNSDHKALLCLKLIRYYRLLVIKLDNGEFCTIREVAVKIYLKSSFIFRTSQASLTAWGMHACMVCLTAWPRPSCQESRTPMHGTHCPSY